MSRTGDTIARLVTAVDFTGTAVTVKADRCSAPYSRPFSYELCLSGNSKESVTLTRWNSWEAPLALPGASAHWTHVSLRPSLPRLQGHKGVTQSGPSRLEMTRAHSLQCRDEKKSIAEGRKDTLNKPGIMWPVYQICYRKYSAFFSQFLHVEFWEILWY